MDENFDFFERLKMNGASPTDACQAAEKVGNDWTFQIRMLRSVYCSDLVEAREALILAHSNQHRTQDANDFF